MRLRQPALTRPLPASLQVLAAFNVAGTGLTQSYTLDGSISCALGAYV